MKQKRIFMLLFGAVKLTRICEKLFKVENLETDTRDMSFIFMKVV